MEINYFKARKMYGHLDFDLKFNSDISFLIGINGAGKTTVVNSIISLITPSFRNLSKTEFEHIEIGIKHERKKLVISGEKKKDHISLKISSIREDLKIPLYGKFRNYSDRDYGEEMFERYESQIQPNRVLKRIQELPTPMFLGIGRRTQPELENYEEGQRGRGIRSNPNRNIFGSNLNEGLKEASFLAEKEYARVRARQDKLKDGLRTYLMLKVFEYVEVTNRFEFVPVSRDEKREYENSFKTITHTLKELGIGAEDIQREVAPFFIKLNKLLKNIPSTKKAFKSKIESKDSRKVDPLLNWAINRGQYERIIKITKEVESYIKKINDESSSIQKYLDGINGFLEDTNKTITFGSQGLSVEISNGGRRPLSSLSSGERQLFVILTHLAFNPDARTANILIIDEPELSLHLAWQELFVSAIQKANPKLQLIFATHSPSIITTLSKKCIDLS